MAFTILPYLLLGIAAVQAFPTGTLISRQDADVTPLSTAQIDAFTPYTYFAKAAYCHGPSVASWTCGKACDGNPDFTVTDSGGDGDDVQYWYVGFWQNGNSVVVAHQGTNTSQDEALTTDVKLGRKKLVSSLFPGISEDIEVHKGFLEEHAKTAELVLSAVQTTMSLHQTSSVTVVGHSLGAALALLDSVYLHLQIPDAKIRTTTFGQPRVGNEAFANYVDGSGITYTRITNQKDPIPIVPGKFLGYSHSTGEVHIEEDESWMNCPGWV